MPVHSANRPLSAVGGKPPSPAQQTSKPTLRAHQYHDALSAHPQVLTQFRRHFPHCGTYLPRLTSSPARPVLPCCSAGKKAAQPESHFVLGGPFCRPHLPPFHSFHLMQPAPPLPSLSNRPSHTPSLRASQRAHPHRSPFPRFVWLKCGFLFELFFPSPPFGLSLLSAIFATTRDSNKQTAHDTHPQPPFLSLSLSPTAFLLLLSLPPVASPGERKREW